MDLELQEAFGRNMRALRRRRGLTQAAMAEAMSGLDRTYIGAIERGEKNLGLETVARLCRFADVDPFEMLRRPDVDELRAAATGEDPGEDNEPPPQRPRRAIRSPRESAAGGPVARVDR